MLKNFFMGARFKILNILGFSSETPKGKKYLYLSFYNLEDNGFIMA